MGDHVTLIETLKRCGSVGIHGVWVYAGRRPARLVYKITGSPGDDILADALAWCAEKRLRVQKIVLAGGEVLLASRGGLTVAKRTDDALPAQYRLPEETDRRRPVLA
jgi:hypothetical protein